MPWHGRYTQRIAPACVDADRVDVVQQSGQKMATFRWGEILDLIRVGETGDDSVVQIVCVLLSRD